MEAAPKSEPSPPSQPIRGALDFMRTAPRLIVTASVLLFSLDALACLSNRLARGSAAIAFTAMLLRFVLRAWLRPGYLQALDDARRGNAPSVSSFAAPGERFEAMMVAALFGDAVTVLSLVVGTLPGLALISYAAHDGLGDLEQAGIALAALGSGLAFLYAWLGVRFTEHAIALEGLGPFAALARAWRIARGRRIGIMRVVLFSSALELVGLASGLCAFGVGVLCTVPMARMAGDHALLTRFAELTRASRVRAPVREQRRTGVWAGGLAGARGATLPEYALLLVAILLAAGSAFHGLGAKVSASADSARTAVSSGADSGGGASGLGAAVAAAGGTSSGLGGFLKDAVKGAVLGDFAKGGSAGTLTGQTLASLIPIVSQVAAARDIVAAAIDVAHGKPGAGVELLGAAAGAVPGFGPELKAAVKASSAIEKVAAKEGAELIEAGAAAAADKAAAKAEANEVAAAAKPGKSIGYHATFPEAADSILNGSFRPGTAKGRLGSGGVYVNDTPAGAIAEFENHHPGVTPSVLEVEYEKGVNASAGVAPRDYYESHPLNVDSISGPSVRKPGTTNTNILNGSAKPIRKVQ